MLQARSREDESHSPKRVTIARFGPGQISSADLQPLVMVADAVTDAVTASSS